MTITKQAAYSGDFEEEAARRRVNGRGKTKRYSTGLKELDTYIGGGFGREEGYEIVLIFGATGIGKSTIALNFLAGALLSGVKVGVLALEDDMPDVNNRLYDILGENEYKKMNNLQILQCIPENALDDSWNLEDLLEYIRSWFENGNELILIDHLQFAFEGAESIKGENEYIAQRIFMKKLNTMMKKNGKTLIMISHVNKGKSVGMEKIVGSGSIAQASTKVIEVSEGDLDNGLQVYMRKSRFTPTPKFSYEVKLIKSKIEAAF